MISSRGLIQFNSRVILKFTVLFLELQSGLLIYQLCMIPIFCISKTGSLIGKPHEIFDESLSIVLLHKLCIDLTAFLGWNIFQLDIFNLSLIFELALISLIPRVLLD
jgi:hypothetical protein